MNEKMARPRLTLADIELLLNALDREGMAAPDLDGLEKCSELAARLQSASRPLRRAES